MKLLVTGGLGFIGSHLSDSLLLDKHKVIILTRNLNSKSKIIDPIRTNKKHYSGKKTNRKINI